MAILAGYFMCTHAVHGFLPCDVCDVFIAVPCKRVCGLTFASGLGWMTIYLNSTYGSIRHGIRVIFHAWYEKIPPIISMIVLDL